MSDVLMLPLLAEGSWAGGLPGWLVTLGHVAPWLLLAVVLVLLVRAVLRQPRYRAVSALDEAARRRVTEAVAAAERRTVGEIVPVVVERSDPHPGAPWLGATLALLLGSTLLITVLPWDHPPTLILCQALLAAAGWAAVRLLPDLQRLLVPVHRRAAVAEEQALQEFFRQGLFKTEAATGVLLFVSLLERQAVVLADTGIDAEVTEGQWTKTTEALLAGASRGTLEQGLLDAVAACGDVLAEHFPWQQDDRNELPDRLVVRRE